jgi:hypothetical protein
MSYTPREVELLQLWAKIKQINDIIIILTSEKNKLTSQTKKVQKLVDQQTLEV